MLTNRLSKERLKVRISVLDLLGTRMIARENLKWMICKGVIMLCLICIAIVNFQEFFYKGSNHLTTHFVFCLCCYAAMAVMTFARIELKDTSSRFAGLLAGIILVLFSIYISDEIVNKAKTNAELEAIPTLSKEPLWLAIAVTATLVIFVFLLFLTNRIGIAAVGTSFLLYLLSMAVVIVCDFRGTPFMAADLFTARTAMNVAGRYSFKISFFQYACLLTIVLFGFMFTELRGVKAISSVKRRIVLLVLSVLIIGVFARKIVLSDYMNDRGIHISPWRPIDSYRTYGTVTTFLRSIKYAIIEKPEGYSLERVREITSRYTSDSRTDGAEKNTPNIILIINEAYSDLSVLGDFETNKDYMPVYHGLKDNCIKGYFQASIVGGGTARTEFELLTSISDSFLPMDSQPFELFVREELPTMPSSLNDLNYSGRIAMHPHKAENYNRIEAYPLLGFDKFVSIEDLPEDVDKVGDLVSDKAVYDYVIDNYNSNKENLPFYIYTLTMQNHSPYTKSISFDDPVEITDDNKDAEVEQYLNLVYLSDMALEELLEYYSSEEEPTLILFLGDHQPRISDTFLESVTDGRNHSWTEEEAQIRYKTPFFLWANYDIEEEYIDSTSANYMQSIVMETAGISLTGFQKYLIDLREDIPWINSVGYRGADGKYYNVNDTESPYYERIQEYKILEYNYLFGRNNRIDDFFNLAD